MRTEIFLDKREREIDTGGDSGGRIERAILDIQGVSLNLQLRKTRSEIGSESPVGRHISSIHQSRRSNPISASADAGDATRLSCLAPHPLRYAGLNFRVRAYAASARN